MADPLEGDALEPETDSEPPPRPVEYDIKSSFERILPDLIRRGFEVGRGPLEKVSESLFPKDIAAGLVGQLGDIRTGIAKAVAQEVGRFLHNADIASEIRKVLTGLDIEAQVRLRFKAREDGSDATNVKVEISDVETRSAKKARRRQQG